MNNFRRIAQAYAQTPWRRQVQYVGIFLTALLLIVVIASVYLNITTRAAAYGREILLMQREITNLEMLNADLRTDLGVITSAFVMEQRALDMGFQRVQKGEEMYILVPGFVRQETEVFAPPPEPVRTVSYSLPPVFSESIIDWLRQRFMVISPSPSEVTP